MSLARYRETKSKRKKETEKGRERERERKKERLVEFRCLKCLKKRMMIACLNVRLKVCVCLC